MNTEPADRTRGGRPPTRQFAADAPRIPAVPRPPAPPAAPPLRVPRREQRHVETRDEILQVAREIVAEKGAEHLNLREVARRANFGNPASLYRYFASKLELMYAIGQQCLDLLADHLTSVPAGLPPDERIVELGMAYLEFAQDHPQELSLMSTILEALPPDDQLAVAPPAVLDLVIGVVREAAAAGLLAAPTEDDVTTAWHGLWALVHGMAAIERMHALEPRLVLRGRQRDVLRAFVNGLRTEWIEGGPVPSPEGRA